MDGKGPRFERLLGESDQTKRSFAIAQGFDNLFQERISTPKRGRRSPT
jgi:hypothetical protein